MSLYNELMKNLNYKWVLLIGAVLGLIVGTFNKNLKIFRSDVKYCILPVNGPSSTPAQYGS